MFENIIGQDRLVERLRGEIAEGALPRALLFHGEAYRGKMSAALELARALTCLERDALWSCRCRSCEMQRLLVHPYTLLLGSRYFSEEIAAAADALSRTRREPAQFLYARSVRKLLRRFDPVLWERNEGELKGVRGAIEEAEDLLAGLLPGRLLPREGELKTTLGRCAELCEKIARAVSSGISIDQIRRATFWARSTSGGSNKVIILEAVDRTLEGARNALLKAIEEPPEGAFFVLVTTRKSAIALTILSRLRAYHFPARGEAEERGVLEKIFREPEGFRGSLKEYFQSRGGPKAGSLRAAAASFLGSVLRTEPGSRPDEELLAALSGQTELRGFLEELTLELRGALGGGAGAPPAGLGRIERWARLVRQAAAQGESYNQSPSLLVESLYYRMREGA